MMHLDRRWFCDERFNRLVAFTDMLSDATSPRGIIGGLIKRTAGGRRTDQIATTSSIARTALGIEGMGKASHQCRADVANRLPAQCARHEPQSVQRKDGRILSCPYRGRQPRVANIVINHTVLVDV